MSDLPHALSSDWNEPWDAPRCRPPRWRIRFVRADPPAVRAARAARDRGLRPGPAVAPASATGVARVPWGRALGVPVVLAVVFCAASLLVGGDLGARVASWGRARQHRVEPGETLSTIARRHGLVDWRALYAAGDNARRFPDPDSIPVGARIDLPRAAVGRASPRAAAARATAPPRGAAARRSATAAPANDRTAAPPPATSPDGPGSLPARVAEGLGSVPARVADGLGSARAAVAEEIASALAPVTRVLCAPAPRAILGALEPRLPAWTCAPVPAPDPALPGPRLVSRAR